MRLIKRLSLTLILLFSILSAYAGGIKDATDFVAFVNAINSGADISAYRNDKGDVCLDADIDMAKVKKIASVKSFGGVFDGQGFALKNWKAQGALFHTILEGGKVCNLRIDASCEMKVQNRGGEFYAGWIAAINNGTIENCENYASISHKSSFTEHDIYIGGLVGSNRYVIMSCRNYGTVSSNCSGSAAKSESLRIGGIAGANFPKLLACATIIRCENFGTVSYAGDIWHMAKGDTRPRGEEYRQNPVIL